MHRLARGHVELVPRGALRAELRRVHGLGAVDDVIVDAVLREGRRVLLVPEAPGVRLVLTEDEMGLAFTDEPAGAERTVCRLDHVVRHGAELGMAVVATPRPGVAEPQRREDVQRRGLGTAVRRLDQDADVVRRALRVGELDVEVARLLEHPRVDQLELVELAAAASVAVDQRGVGELALRVLVEPPHERVGGRRVERPPVLLGVLAVVALGVRQAVEALLQDRVVRVPEREREAQVLPVVADPSEAVLSPAIRTRPCVLVGEEVPRVATFAVVLAHRAPLTRGDIGAPAAPQRHPVPIFLETLLFGVIDHGSAQSTKDPPSLPG